MDVIWIISFKITTEIEVRKHAFCVLLRRRAVSTLLGHMFFQCDGIRLNSFFTVNNPVIFLKCIFEFVFNTAQLALIGVSMLFFFLYLLFCFICLFVVQLLCFVYSYIFFCLLASFPSFLLLALTLCVANRVPFSLGSFILKSKPFNKCAVSPNLRTNFSLYVIASFYLRVKIHSLQEGNYAKSLLTADCPVKQKHTHLDS